jgi:adenylate/guanylate cyclase family protein/signal transduction histidine kinase-like protein
VEKFVGDAVMAAFGAPVAHEDDAERAVRTGLSILEAIADLNEADPELDLQVRVGINAGEAVVALGARPEHGEGLVTGDVVNTAARIQSAALAPLFRGSGRTPPERAGIRGPALGRRGAARVPRVPGRVVAGVPLLVLCAACPELYERRPGWGAGQRNAHVA